ncbi:hypothetical protein CcaverHIS631_0702400 [Cutaneotrichosporon cavernicola]|nr:hypothetical protein CcaverHIS631_0702400 [Cutaneotrichosporon cavernicola]BEJ10204.1 hypothetical protein CcaverHIS641_0702390 [Cutaneotrichosporon cavernicola]
MPMLRYPISVVSSARPSRPASPVPAGPPPDASLDQITRPSFSSEAQLHLAYATDHGVLPPTAVSGLPLGTTPEALAYAAAHGVFPNEAAGPSRMGVAQSQMAQSQLGGRSAAIRNVDSYSSFPSVSSAPSSNAMSRSQSTMSTNSTPAPSGSGHGSQSHPHSSANPLVIKLDSDHLVLRGQGGDMAPAYLSGYVSLWLAESTNIKDIVMNLSGKAKVHFSDSTTHNYTHNILSHDWSFLKGNKRHAHALKAGLHTFPFSFTIDGNLPSSLVSFTGDGDISYRLRATVIRSGLAFNLNAYRNFNVVRTFTPEALEFNQTLEIENTWPGKIMYSITMPFKAYAAGDSIPVLLKFMPVAKGVRVINITSVIKEYSLVNTRGSSHPETRATISVKHDIVNGRPKLVEREIMRPPYHWSGLSAAAWRPELLEIVPGDNRSAASTTRNSAEGSSQHEVTTEEVLEDLTRGDDELSLKVMIPIPPWTTPTHTIKPVYVTHKIKWSCSLANADGHTSELRCALPICILDNSMLNEARMNGAPARNLLLGIDAEDSSQHVDLPSYSNHVYDRVAVADAGGSGFAGAGSSGISMRSTPNVTPPHSRPGSPSHGRSSNRPRGSSDADDLPPRRQLSDAEHAMFRGLGIGSGPPSATSESPQELSASGSRFASIMGSRVASRPTSRQGSRPGSRAGSRASSPDRNHGSDDTQTERRGLAGLLHMKPLSVLGSKSPILRNGHAAYSGTSSPVLGAGTRSAVSFAELPAPALSDRLSNLEHRRAERRFHVADDDEELSIVDETTAALSRVPSYTDESGTQFVVPLDPNLPSYVDSERQMERARSASDLAGGLTELDLAQRTPRPPLRQVSDE